MSALLPLFPAPSLDGLAALEAERRSMLRRIQELRPHSHRRIALEHEAKLLTTRILQAECEALQHDQKWYSKS